MPSFVAGLTKLPTFDEELRIVQMNPDEPVTSRMDISTPEIPFDTTRTYVVKNISARATQNSLNDHLANSGFSVVMPVCRIMSLLENQQGTFANVKVGELVTVASFGTLVKKSSDTPKISPVGQILYAYGEASPIVEMDRLSWILMDGIVEFFTSRCFAKSHEPVAPEGTKFGGGLARKSAGNTCGRYVIRGRTCDLENVSEEGWKRKGAISVEYTNNGDMCVIRFAKADTRNAACDSFIVLVELVCPNNTYRELGLSRINTATVLVEDYKDEIDLLADFVPVSYTASSARPLPSPRPR
jgi:hypothetical protein